MKNNHYILGLSITYHDPAIAIMNSQGEVLFAEASERYLQLKRGLNNEPDNLFRIGDLVREYCTAPSSITVALNWQKKRPFYEHFCTFTNYFTPQGLMRPRFSKRATFLEKYKIFHMLACQTQAMKTGGINTVRMLRDLFPGCKVNFQYYDHHTTHAAMACYSSPFTEAACVVVDSYGERGSMAFYRYIDGKIVLHKQLSGIESLGFFYMKLTELCGFDWMKGEEWKVMGLAAYGTFDKKIYQIFSTMIRAEGLALQQDITSVRNGLRKLEDLFKRCEPLDAADLAYTGQYFYSQLLLNLLNQYYSKGYSKNLVISGGCALNSVFNGKVTQKTGFNKVYIPPAPADDGTALGAAFLAVDTPQNLQCGLNATVLSPYLGSSISSSTLERLVRYGKGLHARQLKNGLYEETAKLLVAGKLVGWVQGRAEFGPRALGNRSILADPRYSGMKEKINSTVKFREEFRPFAPSILHEYGEQYFENYVETPYMERALRFRDSMTQAVPAVVHVDNTGRLQSVTRDRNEKFYDLISAFYQLTGVPIVLNTSFNVMGKPIVHSIEDAVSVFLTSGLDALVIEDYIFCKPEK